MKLNEIAKTGLTISELGLGCASLAGIFSAVPREQASATIAKAWEKGIRYFDTAPFYGHGRSERLTGDGIRGHDYVLSTKVGRLLRPGAMQNPGAWVDPFAERVDDGPEPDLEAVIVILKKTAAQMSDQLNGKMAEAAE